MSLMAWGRGTPPPLFQTWPIGGHGAHNEKRPWRGAHPSKTFPHLPFPPSYTPPTPPFGVGSVKQEKDPQRPSALTVLLCETF
jgi:hypothetical protein